MENPEVKGRPLHELRRIVAEDNARFDELGEVWNDLTEREQLELLRVARHWADRDGEQTVPANRADLVE